jgi:gamma-glutamyl hercynylcysteine S-oxide hydrolase
MCRMAAYLGQAAPLSALLSDPPHSLTEQAWRPRLQHDPGSVNVDGTGVAWWPAGEAARPPLRYVTGLPPWADPNLPALSRRLSGAAQLALVRSATPGLPYGAWSVAPFVHGRLAVAHNGRIGGFRGAVGRLLLGRLPDDLHGELGALTDSAALAATLAARLRGREPGALAAALAATVLEVEKACADAGETATLTVLAADGERVAGVRAALGGPAQTLFTLVGGDAWPGAALAASEPLDDDPGWTEVPDRHVVELTAAGARSRPLDEEAGR